MKVAYDTSSSRGGNATRGIGVNTNELLEALGNRVDAFDFRISNFKLKIKNYDIAHYTNFNPNVWSVPFVKPTKKVVLTIHDLIRLLYPKAYPSGIRGAFRFLIQKQLIRLNVDEIITISEASKEDIAKYLGVSREKISVVYLAPQKFFRRLNTAEFKKQILAKFGLPQRFVLYVGDVNYNKNLSTLAEACSQVGCPLVMVGKNTLSKPSDHIEQRPFVEFLKKYKNDKNIMRLGFVADDDLLKIWNLATLYCQPSYSEGFGLPLLESMACGVPVIASGISVHKEVGGNACLYFDPHDSSHLVRKIQMVLDVPNIRQELIEKGNQQVKKFSWTKTAQETLKIYAKVYSDNS